MTTDLVRATWQHLQADDPLMALLGSSTDWPYWLFRWKAYISLEGTSESMIVVSQNGSWATANPHNTMRFPKLQVEIFTDPERNTLKNPTGRTTEVRALEVYEALDPLLHMPYGGEVTWGADTVAVRILGSKRTFGEPEILPVPEGDGMIRVRQMYEVSLG